jgi:hypothetical protein
MQWFTPKKRFTIAAAAKTSLIKQSVRFAAMIPEIMESSVWWKHRKTLLLSSVPTNIMAFTTFCTG